MPEIDGHINKGKIRHVTYYAYLFAYLYYFTLNYLKLVQDLSSGAEKVSGTSQVFLKANALNR